MSFEVKIKVLSIPCFVRGSVTEADPSVGIISEGLEDVTFHNVKNESLLNWLEEKVERLDKWDEVNEDIWAAIEKKRDDY